jgi:cytochrome bd-type quinol oxidase subunit 2
VRRSTNLATATKQLLAHVLVATISIVLARLALWLAWRRSTNLALAAKQLLEHVLVATIPIVLARLALWLTWRRSTNLALAAKQLLTHILVATVSAMLAGLTLRRARCLTQTSHELAALLSPLAALAPGQPNLATSPTFALRAHVHEAST